MSNHCQILWCCTNTSLRITDGSPSWLSACLYLVGLALGSKWGSPITDHANSNLFLVATRRITDNKRKLYFINIGFENYFLGFLFPFPFDRDFSIFCVFLSTTSSPLFFPFLASPSFIDFSDVSFPFVDSPFTTVVWIPFFSLTSSFAFSSVAS